MDFASFVLAASTADLGDEPDARSDADAVEFRMDLADDPLATLDAYEGELPLICTNRAAWEGGEATADAGRLDTLSAAAEHRGVEAVDIELESVTNGEGARVVDRAHEVGASVIVSAHDFDASPGSDGIRRQLMRGNDLGDVAKVAITAADRGDVLELLSVTHERDAAGDRVATMAMGEAGRHSRAVAPLYGSRIGYAPVSPAAATAPGQYDLSTLRSLVDRLSGRV